MSSKKNLPATIPAGQSLVPTENEKRALAALGEEKRGFVTQSCMEVSKQTFEEIEQIVAASGAYYNNSKVYTQGVWPDACIIFRSGMRIQASQQFDNKAIQQLKTEFRGVFSDIATLRERVQELEAENAQLRAERAKPEVTEATRQLHEDLADSE